MYEEGYLTVECRRLLLPFSLKFLNANSKIVTLAETKYLTIQYIRFTQLIIGRISFFVVQCINSSLYDRQHSETKLILSIYTLIKPFDFDVFSILSPFNHIPAKIRDLYWEPYSLKRKAPFNTNLYKWKNFILRVLLFISIFLYKFSNTFKFPRGWY